MLLTGLAELVCSNSLRSDDAETNAVGLLHAELRDAGKALSWQAADAHQNPRRQRAGRGQRTAFRKPM